MLDRHLHPRVKPALNRLVSVLDKPGITPDGLTLTGFAIGVLALGIYPKPLTDLMEPSIAKLAMQIASSKLL